MKDIQLSRSFATQITDRVLRMKLGSSQLDSYYQTYPDLKLKFIIKRLQNRKDDGSTHSILIKMTEDANSKVIGDNVVVALHDHSSFDKFGFVLSKAQFHHCPKTEISFKTFVFLSAIIKESSILIINTYQP